MVNFCQNFHLLDSELINFINLDDNHRELVRNWRNHPDIKKWMKTDHIISVDEHLGFIGRLKSDRGNFYWLVKNSGQNIGVIYLNNVDFKHKTAYLGVYANPELRGVGSTLMAALRELSFNLARLHSLKLEVREDNQRAVSLYQRSGFSQEGLLREVVYQDGQWYDLIIMEMINNYANKN